MLQIILNRAMTEKNMSSHAAAEQIGVSHTTILRALRGERVDVDTIIKIADWLHLRPSELLDSMSENSETSTADQIAILLSHSPELEAELKDAAERVKAGVLDPAVVRDIVSYALYKLNTTSGDISNAAPSNRTGARTRR